MVKVVKLPRDAAFSIRNRLIFRGIPYKEIRIDVIGVDERHYPEVEKILKEFELKANL